MNKKVWFCLLGLLMSATVAMAAGKKFTLVIDPGHGGRDHGAPGVYSKEKDLVLKFGLAFGRMVERNCPDVKVIYTRKTDVFIPLVRRAEIANRNKADLFVSIHINALAGGRKVRGVQTYTLGRGQKSGTKGIIENLEVAKRENSVILLEKNYQQTYQGFDPNSPESSIMFEFIQDKNMEQSVELAKYMQRSICAATGLNDMGAHQNNLAVLRLSSMPGCLLELGFISTPEEEDFMNSDAATEKYARGIYNAFVQYKNKYHKGLVVPYQPAEKVRPEVPQIVPEVYKSQAETKDARAGKKPVRASAVAGRPQEKGTEDDSMKAVPTAASGKEGETGADAPAGQTVPVVQKVPSAAAQDASAPVFKIQILTSSRKLELSDAVFKGLKGCEWYKDGGDVKYTYGASLDYQEIRRLRREIVDRFPDAFIIAFKDGQRMDVNEAIRVFMKNKKK